MSRPRLGLGIPTRLAVGQLHSVGHPSKNAGSSIARDLTCFGEVRHDLADLTQNLERVHRYALLRQRTHSIQNRVPQIAVPSRGPIRAKRMKPPGISRRLCVFYKVSRKLGSVRAAYGCLRPPAVTIQAGRMLLQLPPNGVPNTRVAW